jgi:hypothetical protein
MILFSDFFEKFKFKFFKLQISDSMGPELQMSAFAIFAATLINP